MPFTNVGGNGSTVNVRPPAARPRPAAPPPPRVVANPDQQVQTPRPTGAPPTHTDITSSGPGYGSAAANRYKATPQYRQAVAQVFKIQPAAQKAAIIRGLVTQNLFSTPEFPAIHAAFIGLIKSGDSQAQKVANLIPNELPKFLFAGSPKGLSSFNMADSGLFGVQHEPGAAQILGGLLNQFRTSTTPQGVGTNNIASVEGGTIGNQFAKGAVSDAVNLPAEALSTIGTVGSDLFTKGPGKAASDVVDPYVQLLEHPGQAFIQHPILSTLMATGALHGATRLAAAPVRALAPKSAVGKAISTQREGIALTGNLTHERPPYSLSPTIKAQQVAREQMKYDRAPDGRLVPKTQQARAKLMNKNIGELVGTRERIRRVNQDQVKAARTKAIMPGQRFQSRAANLVGRNTVKATHGAKTALQYGPKAAVIPGAEALARVADLTARRPSTYTADLTKHLEQVAANRPNLLDEPKALKAHDAYVKAIQAEIGKNRTPASLKPVFAAAEKYRADYAPVQERARSLGHFGDMSAEALQRRSLMHYAVTHMGAKFDPERGLVDANGRPLPTKTILEHAKQATGGRLPAYTPDRVRFDESKNASFYVPSERRPLPATKANTLYAYTHGLTDPSHMALTEQHALMQGIVDSHHSQNTYLETLANQMPGGGYARTYAEAKDAAPAGYKPINIAQPFHPQESLDKALEGTAPQGIEEEAVRRSLDLSRRLEPGGAGRWALIDGHALKVLNQFEKQISPNPLLRTIRGLNNQFRTVVLSTSAKHIPGVMFENLIRDVGYGVGFRSWLTGHGIKAILKQTPEGRERVTQLTGGQVAGMTEAGKTHRVSEHWAGTNVHPLLKALEATFKAPGPRQIRSAWNAWTHFAIHGTKLALEQQHQIAGMGKAALREHGYAEAARAAGFTGLVQRAFGLHGKLLDDAARGMYDPAKARQMRAIINTIYGKWTDLSPSAQTALMFSPFGLWWVNSAKFLARMPVDQPVKTGLLASATAGTQQERRSHGLDMLMKGALPLYMQGGIPHGDRIIAQNYYSPFGVMNDPLETGASLIQPWALPILQGAGGVNWQWKPLTSPTNKHGNKPSNVGERAQYILNSALASFMPLYTKAEQVAAGGASTYDVSPNFPAPATKKSGKGAGVGLAKALQPFRSYAVPKPTAKKAASGLGGTGGGGGWWSSGGGSSSGSSSGGGWWSK